MSDSDILYLVITAGVGGALFFAGREFVRGVRAAMHEYNDKASADTQSESRGDSGRQSESPPEDGISSRPWYEVLEVSVAAGPDEIKTAYRRRIALYHPDKVSGLGPELRLVAEKHAKEINAAYAVARKLRGF